jgi:hypothetical protein
MSASELIPSARRLMESLRDIGYDLPSAVADLVDNSIDADAEQVFVDVGHDRDGGWIRIADDGIGMSEGRLDEAMRYGSSRRYGEFDLGRFGLGLKTASLSQCRRLTVATRSTLRGPVRVRRWDLDHVARTDSWHLERLTPRECPTILIDPLVDRTGTVVLWQRLDRVLGVRRPSSDAAARRLESAASEIADHLAMVFHRFLSGEAPGPPLEIRVGDSPLVPWDPFARGERFTRVLAPQALPLEHDGVRHDVIVQPFVLPAQHLFSSPEAHEFASGPNRWNRQQGLYVYRRDRLIQSGGWNRLRTLDEHAKLARIAVDIPSDAETAFRINVSKMTVGLPESVRPQLRALVAGVVSVAQDVYRRRLAVIAGDGEHKGDAESESRSSVTVGDQWPLILDVLNRHLDNQAELLDRLLVDLANVRPADLNTGSRIASQR